ncbi:hypothetical protein H2200_001064, partial [Cladophialophora chaetospira]
RRRKIRCSYGPDSANECTRCLLRGISCVVPRQRDIEPDSEKRTLRERVSKLESLLASLLQKEEGVKRTSLTGVNDVGSEGEDMEEELLVARRAPLIVALEASELLSTRLDGSKNGDRRPGHLAHESCENAAIHRSITDQRNDTHLCDELKSAIPPYEELRATFSRNAHWWDSWHMKTFGANAVSETLSQFFDRSYWTGTVVEMGFLISAFGRHTPANASHYMTLVDHMILANDRYAGTLDGLLLTVFHGKVYLDIGQPHRGFMCNRRGISLAQSLNLHRNYARSKKRSVVWWTLYLGDRFLSVLLGLPYAISDNHFTVTLTQDPNQVGHASRSFAIQLAVLMGRVIDQVHSRNGSKLSEVMDIEDELETLAGTNSKAWWDFSIPSVAGTAVKNDLRERLMCQMQFYLTKVFLHLPYLLKSASSQLYNGSRLIAIDSARGLILRYQALRSSIDSEPLFDCQSLDFVGFMGAVVLLLGTYRSNTLPEDVKLMQKTMKVLQQLAPSQENHLAHQCESTLRALLAICLPDQRHGSSIPSEIHIPYFGVLQVSRPAEVQTSGLAGPSPEPTAPEGPDNEAHSAESAIEVNKYPTGGLPSIEYQGLYNFDYMDWMQGEMVPESADSMPDLGQDWESFLEF